MISPYDNDIQMYSRLVDEDELPFEKSFDSEDSLVEYLFKNPRKIKEIRSNNKQEELALAIIKKFPRFIIFISNNQHWFPHTTEVFREAVRRNPSLLEDLGRVDAELSLIAIKLDKENLKYVKNPYDKKFVRGWLDLGYLAEELPLEPEHYLELFKEKRIKYKEVPKAIMDLEIFDKYRKMKVETTEGIII